MHVQPPHKPWQLCLSHYTAFNTYITQTRIKNRRSRHEPSLFWFLPYRVWRRTLLRHAKNQPLIQTSFDDQTNVFSLRFPLLLDDDSGSLPPTPLRTSLRVPVVALPVTPSSLYSNTSAIAVPIYSNADSRVVHAYSRRYALESHHPVRHTASCHPPIDTHVIISSPIWTGRVLRFSRSSRYQAACDMGFNRHVYCHNHRPLVGATCLDFARPLTVDVIV